MRSRELRFAGFFIVFLIFFSKHPFSDLLRYVRT